MPDIESSSIFNEMDIYWIVLIIVGIFMFISSVITIIVLCLIWRRHRKSIIQFNNKPSVNTVEINDRQSQNYEIQKIEIFVPEDEEDIAQKNIGEFHAYGTPQDGIQKIHQYYPRTNKVYF